MSQEANLKEFSREFYLNEKEIKRRLIGTIALLGIAAFILSAIVIQDTLALYIGPLTLPSLAASIYILFSFLTKRALDHVKLKISSENGVLKFPYYYLWTSEIPCERISSSEEIIVNGKLEAVVLGFKRGALTYFDKAIFSNESQLNEFQYFLLAIVKRNSEHGLGKSIEVVERNITHLYIQIVFISIWVATFYLTSLDFTENVESILEKGALSREAIFAGEVYRLFSSFYLHSSLAHIGANIIVFSVLSQSMLRVVDIYKYLSILFVSSLFASFTTLVMHADEFIVGSSGGIFGLFGAFCAVRMDRKLPGSIGFISDISVLILICIEVVSGAFNERVDFYSHVGGFFAGFLFIRLLLATESSQTIYSSSFFGRLIAIVLSVLSMGSLLFFLLRIFVEPT